MKHQFGWDEQQSVQYKEELEKELTDAATPIDLQHN
jgi:hypothetical protein